MRSDHINSSIFVVISKDIIRRNIFDTAFWYTFLSYLPKDQQVVLVVNEADRQQYDEHQSERVIVEGYERQPHRGWQAAVNFLIRTGIDSHSTRTYRMRALKRGETSVLLHAVKALLANTFGRFGWYQRFLRRLFLRTHGPGAIDALFAKYQPEAVFAPSLIDNEFDAQFARVAKQRGVKLIGMVRSWDNLNNHGALSVVPDVFYFQNRFLLEAAQRFQDISIDDLPHEVVGLPHYDEYFEPGALVAQRDAFMRDLGLDPDKKLVLLGGSDFYYSEDVLPKILNDAIASGAITEPTQVVFRPHPSSIFSKAEYGLEALPHVHLNDAFSGGQKFTDGETFLNLLYHADVIINIASTLSIDAAVFDTPAICINFDDPQKKLSYYEEVHRLYDHFDHYERLVATGGVETPRSPEELVQAINEAFADPAKRSEGRSRIIDTFVAPFDGKAGERLAQTVAQSTQ